MSAIVLSIFNAIAAMPTLLGYVKQLVSWISEQVELAEKRKLAADMAKATEKAKKTKDTSDIDSLFRGGR